MMYYFNTYRAFADSETMQYQRPDGCMERLNTHTIPSGLNGEDIMEQLL